MSDTDTALTTAKALARTYEGPANPWERVQEYERVLEYKSHHPNKGSSAVASALDLPRGRIRPWLDGGAPDVVRGVRTAEEHGWLDLDARKPAFRGLNVFVAWIYSSGSITRRYVPRFIVTSPDDRGCLQQAADCADIDLRAAREGEPSRADELVPAADASVLGRVLSTLGAPVGEKVTLRQLPAYLDDTPDRIRREFARIYLQNRATPRPDKELWQIKEERPDRYIESLARFFRDTMDTRVEYGANLIRIWDDAIAESES